MGASSWSSWSSSDSRRSRGTPGGTGADPLARANEPPAAVLRHRVLVRVAQELPLDQRLERDGQRVPVPLLVAGHRVRDLPAPGDQLLLGVVLHDVSPGGHRRREHDHHDGHRGEQGHERVARLRPDAEPSRILLLAVPLEHLLHVGARLAVGRHAAVALDGSLPRVVGGEGLGEVPAVRASGAGRGGARRRRGSVPGRRRPRPRATSAVLGMSCMSPWAPLGDTASGRKPDSTETTASTSPGSRPCRRAAAAATARRSPPAGTRHLVEDLVRHEAAHRGGGHVHLAPALQHQDHQPVLGPVRFELQGQAARQEGDLRPRARSEEREQRDGEERAEHVCRRRRTKVE